MEEDWVVFVVSGTIWDMDWTWDMDMDTDMDVEMEIEMDMDSLECAVHVHRQEVNLAQTTGPSCSVSRKTLPRAPAAGPTNHDRAASMLPATHVRAQDARRTA